jgi:predicted SprT family Zn-dependent metalloprotease
MKFIFDSNLAGFILSNGIFYLNPVSIKCETDFDKTVTLDIITHELSHLNQTVDYDKYNNDEEYHKLIELENETNVYNFIMNNINTIQKVLNFKVEKKYLDHLLWFISL